MYLVTGIGNIRLGLRATGQHNRNGNGQVKIPAQKLDTILILTSEFLRSMPLQPLQGFGLSTAVVLQQSGAGGTLNRFSGN